MAESNADRISSLETGVVALRHSPAPGLEQAADAARIRASVSCDPLQSPKARRYQITQRDLEILEAQQNGLCAICHEPFTETPAIDHCHETGLVRGLLHARCNLLLGMARDRPDVLLRAAEYLGAVAPNLQQCVGTTAI
jgi:hypothetical protein